MTIFLLFDLKRKIYYLIFEKIMGKPHPSVRRHRLLKAPGHVISSVVATSSLATTTNSSVQKSVRSQASSAGVDIDDADAVEAFNATSSTSSNTELEDEEEDEQQQRFVGKS